MKWRVLVVMLGLLLGIGGAFAASTYKVVIHNPNDYALTNYQVRIDLSGYISTPTYLKVTENGKVLPFTYEQPNGECGLNPTTVIWVKVPYIPANGNTIIHIMPAHINYAVSPNDVFIIYKDFRNLNGVEIYPSSTRDDYNITYVNINGIKTPVLVKKNSLFEESCILINLSKPLNTNEQYCLEERCFRPNREWYGSHEREMFLNSSLYGYGAALNHEDNELYIFKQTPYPSVDESNVPLTKTKTPNILSEFYTLRLIYSPTQLTAQAVLNGSVVASTSLPNFHRYTFDKVLIGGGSPIYIEYVRLRKFASSEPVISITSSGMPVPTPTPTPHITPTPSPITGHHPPVAIITPHVVKVYQGQTITLSALSSYDPNPNGRIVVYQWTDENGNILSNSPVLRCTLPAGTHTITLRVTDNYGLSSTDTASVEVIQKQAGMPAIEVTQSSIAPKNGLLTVSVANTGDAPAYDVRVIERIPSGIVVSYVEGATSSGGLVIWSGNLQPSQEHTIRHSIKMLTSQAIIPVTVKYKDPKGMEHEIMTSLFINTTATKKGSGKKGSGLPISQQTLVVIIALIVVGAVAIAASRRRPPKIEIKE